jgi:hypothetical protein
MPEALRIFLPDRAGFAFVLLLGFFLFVRPLIVLSDASTATHILSGLYFLQHHAPQRTMYYSALTPDAKFVSTSVVADLLFAALYNTFSLNGLVALTAVAMAGALTASYQLARLRGLGLLSGFIAMGVAAYTTTIHWSARPHVLSYVFFIAAYYLIFAVRNHTLVRTVSLGIVTLLWANTHGSYVFVFPMLICKLCGDLLAPPQADRVGVRPADSTLVTLGALAACTVASCMNFSGGFSFLVYAATYTRSITSQGAEWQSIDFGVTAVWGFLFFGAAMVALWTYSEKKPPLSEFAFAAAMFVFGIKSMRVMPYFALVALPVLALQWQSWRSMIQRKAEAEKTIPLKMAASTLQFETKAERGEPNSVLMPAIWTGVTIAMLAAFCLMPQLRLADYDPNSVPVHCTNYLRQHHTNGLVFTQDVWASYVYEKTHQPVFVNEYQDLFPKEQMDDYIAVFFNYPGWQSVLDKYNFQYVLLPRGLPAVSTLKADPNWTRLCDDESSVLFERNVGKK